MLLALSSDWFSSPSLSSDWFSLQSLLETHDSVASQECETPPPSPCDYVDHADPPGESHTHSLPHPPEAIRMVGIRKVAGEHLVRRTTHTHTHTHTLTLTLTHKSNQYLGDKWFWDKVIAGYRKRSYVFC